MRSMRRETSSTSVRARLAARDSSLPARSGARPAARRASTNATSSGGSTTSRRFGAPPGTAGIDGTAGIAPKPGGGRTEPLARGGGGGGGGGADRGRGGGGGRTDMDPKASPKGGSGGGPRSSAIVALSARGR